ncbi:MAG TPA: hypothetical protein DIW47_00105 [Bacteroidetes bacterium]|nr:hypothetical protein [Bacteroidota bacterium]
MIYDLELLYLANMLRIILFFSLTLFVQRLFSQSFRGLAPLNDTVCWVSGSKGTVLKTENGGATWDTISPAGYSTKEFRDIHVYDHKHALLMSSGENAVILSTRDGGKSWQTVHSNNRAGVFYDAMDAFGPYVAVIGDPYKPEGLDHLVFDMILSCDSGKTWICPFAETWREYWAADSGEAFFAASGTNLILDYKGYYHPATFDPKNLQFSMVSGGSNPRLYMNGSRMALALNKGPSSGAYGHARASKRRMVIVGGDYTKPDSKEKNCLYYDQKAQGYFAPATPPNGYRSGIAQYNDGQLWVCTGTNGTDISKDDGKTWSVLPLEGYNSCAFSKKYLWLCGDKGRVLRVAAPTG